MRRNQNHIRRTREDVVLDTIIYILLAIVLFICAYPFWYGLVLSLNDSIDTAKGGMYFWPRVWTLENYIKFFRDSTWLNGFLVSVARTLTGSAITTLFTMLVSYGLSHEKLVFRRLYMAIIIFSMYFSGGLIPYYVLLRNLKLLNTFWVYVVPPALNTFFIFIAISFFNDIPEALKESGKLDGASEMRIFRSIILPISLPLMVTILLFSAVGQWNAWFDSAFYVTNKQLRTMGYLLMETINQANVPSNAVAAAQAAASAKVDPLAVRVTAMMISVIPILAIYPFLQKYFVTGLTIGSVKG
ncbi:MAG: carbohydrate ABC transporter permease [Candidatus Limiplasma sp.]|nr:carbohydrate ABC transporter permease [Candidatus Limiplasma sp.]